MNNTWWKQPSDLDDEQKRFIKLNPDGNHILIGPPGCGKTNLLLLRAKYQYGTGLKNILFLTYTKSLADFIRSGIDQEKHFAHDKVQTVGSWAWNHIRTYTPGNLEHYKELVDKKNKDPKKNQKLASLISEATRAAPTEALYDAIFIDEVQDLSHELVEEISKLSSRVTIGGDARQGLYNEDGLKSAGFEEITLKYHYRTGRKICEVADKLLPPKPGEASLLEYSQYDEEANQSDAQLFKHNSLSEQFASIIDRLKQQMRAFPNEILGVLFAKVEQLKDFEEYIKSRDISDQIAIHRDDAKGHQFSTDKIIHAMTVHGAKGAEFRAIHIAAAEQFSFPMHRREVIFTAVTRAKTSLSVHYTGKVNGPIESAFSEKTNVEIEDLF